MNIETDCFLIKCFIQITTLLMKKILIIATISIASLGLFSCQDDSKEVFEEAEVAIEDTQSTSGHLIDYDAWSE